MGLLLAGVNKGATTKASASRDGHTAGCARDAGLLCDSSAWLGLHTLYVLYDRVCFMAR